MGALSVTVPSWVELAEVDRAWRDLRPADDPAYEWSWERIGRACPDRFGVRDEDGELVALWASPSAVPARLPEGPAYRLGWFEVRYELRDSGRGAACLALIAARAIEITADRVVLGASPNERTCRFYEVIGAEQRLPRGWKVEEGLVPYVLGPVRTRELKELADALEASSG